MKNKIQCLIILLLPFTCLAQNSDLVRIIPSGPPMTSSYSAGTPNYGNAIQVILDTWNNYADLKCKQKVEKMLSEKLSQESVKIKEVTEYLVSLDYTSCDVLVTPQGSVGKALNPKGQTISPQGHEVISYILPLLPYRPIPQLDKDDGKVCFELASVKKSWSTETQTYYKVEYKNDCPCIVYFNPVYPNGGMYAVQKVKSGDSFRATMKWPTDASPDFSLYIYRVESE